MKRLRTRFEYHDSVLTGYVWPEDDELRLTFRLNGRCNDGCDISVNLSFLGVRNRTEVEESLATIASKMTHQQWLADVVAVVRDSPRVYLVDTSQGPILIDASSMLEA